MLANRQLQRGKFILFQLLILVSGIIINLFFGTAYSYSFALGGSLMFVANIIFLFRMFVRNKQYSPFKEVAILYACEFIKLMLVAIGTVIIAVKLDIRMYSYIVGLILMQVSVWCMPLFTKITEK